MSKLNLLSTLVVAGAIASTALTGCSSNSSSGSSSGPSTANLTGSPVLVGLSSTEQGASSDPNVRIGAQAAITAVNNNGGVHGHPLKLDLCKNDGTAGGVVACANQFITDKVAVSLEGADVAPDAKVAPLKAAGIPIFGIQTNGTAVLQDPYSTITSVSTSLEYKAVLLTLKNQGAKKIVIVAPDQGAAVKQSFENLIIPSYHAAGMDAVYTTFEMAAPDFSSAVTSAQAAHADTIAILGFDSDCTNLIKTARTLGYSGQIFASYCTKFATALGSQAKNVLSFGYVVPAGARATAPVATQHDIDVYEKAMKAAGKSSDVGSFAAYGFSAVMTLASALDPISGEVTAASAKPALDGFKGNVFMGQPNINCAQRPSPGGSCGTAIAVLKTNDSGNETLVNRDFLPVS